MVVVLPAPFGPSRPKISPGETAKLAPSSARVAPKRMGEPGAANRRLCRRARCFC